MSTIKTAPANRLPQDSLEPTCRGNIRPIAGLAALLLFSIFGLMIPLPDGGRILPKLGDMAHGPLFAGITFGLVMAWNHLRPPIAWNQRISRLVVASIIALGFGGLTEVAQGLTGRTASLQDLAADACGIVAACCFLIAGASVRINSLTIMSIFLVLLGTTSIAISWLSPLASINDAFAMKKEFPLLGSFERKAELERWHFANCYARRVRCMKTNKNTAATDVGSAATDGDWAMEVSYQPGPHSSATLYEMQPNWTQGNSIVIDAFALKDPTLPSGKIEIAVQIIDAHHDEDFQDICRKVFVLELGKSTKLEIPREQWITILGRPLDVDKILYLDLQIASRPANATVRFDAIRLLVDQHQPSHQPADGLAARVAR